MTTRLYYDDSYLTAFDARVISCDEHNGRFHVTLDRTAFYPTSGGQPFDIGTLGDAIVVEVAEREDGSLLHITDMSVATGSAVAGAIDWGRRFDHMQQHTGQHILSAAFDRVCGARTESFHLGKDASSIDLAREVSPEDIKKSEDEANRVVWENRPVAVRSVSEEEARQLPLRKESLRTGTLRLIDIRDFDLSACGGTHVSATGSVGVITISGWERFRGGTRAHFLCGGRTLGRFREWRAVLADTTRHLSVQPAELASTVERLQSDAKALQKRVRDQQDRLAVHEARALVERAEQVGAGRVLVETLPEWDAAGLKSLAVAATAAAPTLAVALFTSGEPRQGVIAAGSASHVDASAALKTLVGACGGKGGGKRELAQGGGFTAAEDLLHRTARAALSGN